MTLTRNGLTPMRFKTFVIMLSVRIEPIRSTISPFPPLMLMPPKKHAANTVMISPFPISAVIACILPAAVKPPNAAKKPARRKAIVLIRPTLIPNRNAAFSELPTAYRLRPKFCLVLQYKDRHYSDSETMTATGNSNYAGVASAIKPSGR